MAARLVLASAGPRGIDAVAPSPEPGSIDWDALLIYAQHEGASGVLRRQFALSKVHVLPPSHANRLERLARIMDFQATYLSDRLDETIREFERLGVPVVLLKGAALARTAYASFAERPMGDLDLLVSPDHVAGALEAVRAAGWRGAPERYAAADYAGHQHLPPLVDSRSASVRLELHTDVIGEPMTFGISRDELIRASLPLPGAAESVRVPARAHSLLNVCVHFAWSHAMRFGAWRAIRDVGVLAAPDAMMDWPGFVSSVREHRAASCAYWTLRLARSLAAVPVDADVLRALAPYRREAWLLRLERHLELQVLPSDASCPSEKLSGLLWATAIRPVHSGQGRVRPWEVPLSVRHKALRETPPLGARLMRHARRVASWWRYLRRVLVASAIAA